MLLSRCPQNLAAASGEVRQLEAVVEQLSEDVRRLDEQEELEQQVHEIEAKKLWL